MASDQGVREDKKSEGAAAASTSSQAAFVDSTAESLSPASAAANSNAQTSIQHLNAPAKGKGRPPKCRFYQTKKGCRAGASCPFRHDLDNTTIAGDLSGVANPQKPEDQTSLDTAAAQAPSAATASIKPTVEAPSERAVPRPVAAAEQKDPRAFQITQIQRRFSPKEEFASNGDLLLHFGMTPTDPDFPFDINTLDCTLRVSNDFPTKHPTLRVSNKEMERGFQVNVEHGFDAIWEKMTNPNLLNAFKTLDRQLEVILTAQKADIVKIVANSIPRPIAAPNSSTMGAKDVAVAEPEAIPAPSAAVLRPPPISAQRKKEARARRETEVQVLEHRLGRDPQFSKAAEGTIFTVPIEPRKKDALPSQLQAVKAVRLLVPLDYDIEPCTIELLGVEGDAATTVEQVFARHAHSHSDATLLAQINYVASNMHLMAREQPVVTQPPSAPLQVTVVAPPVEVRADQESIQVPITKELEVRETDKAHVKVISRPPEWDMVPEADDEGSDTDDYFSSAGDYDDTSEDEDGDVEDTQDQPIPTSSTLQEKGIMLSFPGLELHGIELLELVVLGLTVKCDRCKDIMDVQRLRPLDEASTSASAPATKDHTTHASCKKCAYPFTLGYRKDILHAHSTRAGYLDLDGCTVVDLLPSTFLPTCSSCSTPFPPAQGVTAVRAQSALAICRTCHSKLSFHIHENKFLRVSNNHGLPLKQVGRPKKENLGVVAGTELPERGRCKHYSKSYRWFRFSCCNKVFPCDKCHDAAEDHPNEFANRMICGWCSREQAYRPEDCGMQGCRRGITGRVRSGFWEGGKGTRDKAKMSRKDPRKFKRRGGGAARTKKA